MRCERKTDIMTLKKIMIEREIERINDLSKVSGINRNTLGNILNGKNQPSADIMIKLVETLKIPPREAGEIFLM